MRRTVRGFSLIELLVVCAIIAVIVGFTIPAATTLIKGSQLTQAAQIVSDQIGLARQLALSKNRSVEVRFYRFGDKETPGESSDNPENGKYRAFQCFEITESGAAVPLTKLQRLPSAVIMNRAELSSLLDEKNRTPKDAQKVPGAPELPRDVKLAYRYQAFRFLQDGSTDLPALDPGSNDAKTWFLTLHSIDLPDTLSELKDPKGGTINFFTLQIDPVSGAIRSYRPSAG
jgi:uncharacterized protein (TIGR02596 family)